MRQAFAGPAPAASSAAGAHQGTATSGSGLARYGEALRTPGALAFAIPGVIGRMPIAMLSLALVILLTAVTGSYGIAGAVAAAAALAYAAMTPVVARLADRYGQARVLRPQVIVFTGATVALAMCAMHRAPVWALAVTGSLSRATMPSLGPMVRSRWSQLLAGTGLLDAAFSLEGNADELIFIIGPVLAVALAAAFTPVTGVLITAALSVAGVAGLTRQRRSEPPAAPVTGGYGPALRSPGLRALIAMTVCLGALFVAVDLAAIAFAAHHGAKAAAGPLLGLYGLGSAIAGVWYGSRRWRAPHASRLTVALAATVAGAAPLAFMPGIWPMAGAITAAGLGISATLASSYWLAHMAVPPGQRTEALPWLTTAAATGTALGAPLAGRLSVSGAHPLDTCSPSPRAWPPWPSHFCSAASSLPDHATTNHPAPAVTPLRVVNPLAARDGGTSRDGGPPPDQRHPTRQYHRRRPQCTRPSTHSIAKTPAAGPKRAPQP